MAKKKDSMKKESDEEITDRVTQLFEEVRRQSKSKKSAAEKDKPTLKDRPKSAVKEKRKARKAAKGEKVITGPSVTVKELAFDYEMDAKELRRLLRRNDVERPGGRWEWPKEGKALRKILKIIKASGKGKN